MKLYLDTNIWIDYLDKKRIMHKQAFNLFEKITEKKHLVLISKIHMHELGKYGLFKEFNEIKNNLYKKGFCK